MKCENVRHAPCWQFVCRSDEPRGVLGAVIVSVQCLLLRSDTNRRENEDKKGLKDKQATHRLRSKEDTELGRAVDVVMHNGVTDLKPQKPAQRCGGQLLVDRLGVELGKELKLKRIVVAKVLLGNLECRSNNSMRV